MSKTQMTLDAERYLYRSLIFNQMGIYGCHEVTIGISQEKKGSEIVDFLTQDTKNIFRAYEIKVTKSDLMSGVKLSFVGHYNYLVMPRSLYDEVKGTPLIPYGVGVVLIYDGIVEKAKRKTITLSDLVKLNESLMRSLSRENEKHKKGVRKWEI